MCSVHDLANEARSEAGAGHGPVFLCRDEQEGEGHFEPFERLGQTRHRLQVASEIPDQGRVVSPDGFQVLEHGGFELRRRSDGFAFGRRGDRPAVPGQAQRLPELDGVPLPAEVVVGRSGIPEFREGGVVRGGAFRRGRLRRRSRGQAWLPDARLAGTRRHGCRVRHRQSSPGPEQLSTQLYPENGTGAVKNPSFMVATSEGRLDPAEAHF